MSKSIGCQPAAAKAGAVFAVVFHVAKIDELEAKHAKRIVVLPRDVPAVIPFVEAIRSKAEREARGKDQNRQLARFSGNRRAKASK